MKNGVNVEKPKIIPPNNLATANLLHNYSTSYYQKF